MLVEEKKLTNKIISRLKQKQPVRISLPGDGILNIDQPVPFLLVYRYPPDGKDYYTYQLGKTESSYVMAHNEPEAMLQPAIQAVTGTLTDIFGACMLLEVWVGEREKPEDFTVCVHHKISAPIADVLSEELNEIKVGHYAFTATTEKRTTVSPPYFKPILDNEYIKKSEILLLGLEIKPSYINPLTGKAYPLFLRDLRSHLGKALKKTFFEFVRLHTSHNTSHFEILGRTVIEDLAWEIDEKLASYSNLFDFLFLVTPVNAEEAWKSFYKSNYQKPPVFHYRHMPIDPELIKRKLFDLPIEEISDPTIAFLFRDKRKEIDRMMNMLAEREKPDFVLSSLQVFGRIDENLLDTAKALLIAVPVKQEKQEKKVMKAEEFALLARQELAYLRDQYPDVSDEVKIRNDIEGILVSKGILYISSKFEVDIKRVTALLQHEVGTHVATYFNGQAQPFRLFNTGVPGYEQLQEGLAVLSEYIVNGLTPARLRILAARVVAVHEMVSGHSFVETFHLLVDKYSFAEDVAFNITMRVYRGGGLTKDAVYLKGLLNLLEYLKNGKELEPLMIGKIRQDYLPIVEELMHRKLLRPIPIKPRFLTDEYKDQLNSLKKGITVFNMAQS